MLVCSAMGKRAADAKGAAKAKAKAKSNARAPKPSAMSEEELAEYRIIHSKLTYRSKNGMEGANEALEALKTNRNSIIEKFRGDKSLSWVPSNFDAIGVFFLIILFLFAIF